MRSGGNQSIRGGGEKDPTNGDNEAYLCKGGSFGFEISDSALLTAVFRDGQRWGAKGTAKPAWDFTSCYVFLQRSALWLDADGLNKQEIEEVGCREDCTYRVFV